jgi:hypothetical protein
MASQRVQELDVLIRARYPVIYIVTWEEARVEEALAQITKRREKKLFLWSVARGIQQYGTPMESKKRVEQPRPIRPSRWIMCWIASKTRSTSSAIYTLFCAKRLATSATSGACASFRIT